MRPTANALLTNPIFGIVVMIQTSNYIDLSKIQKLELVVGLQLMRLSLKKESRKRRASVGPRKPRRRKPVFFSDKIEKMFNSMSQEVKDYILKGE